jgi:hypothetical protein
MNQNTAQSYQSDDYDRAAQRFVIPLYRKDDLGNFEFSSTGTLVKYNGHHYVLMAAHALSNGDSLDQFHSLSTTGELTKITEYSLGYKAFNTEDIIILDCFNQYFVGKNYFNLNITDLRGFDRRQFSWTGYPSSQSSTKKIHNSQSKTALQEKFVINTESGTYFANARYFTITSKVLGNHKTEISGNYNRKRVQLKYRGPMELGPHPQGMSGGAMYFFSKNQILTGNPDDTFRFAGIGLSYKKDGTIIGASRDKIIELLEKLNSENPLKMVAVLQPEPGGTQNVILMTQT